LSKKPDPRISTTYRNQKGKGRGFSVSVGSAGNECFRKVSVEVDWGAVFCKCIFRE
jgi:hypothetical protein